MNLRHFPSAANFLAIDAGIGPCPANSPGFSATPNSVARSTVTFIDTGRR